MVGVIDLFSGGNVAQGLFRASNIATTPNFELQFNTLQNTLIGRLNEKIAEAQADDGLVNGKIDAFLAQAAMKLSATQQGLEIFIFENIIQRHDDAWFETFRTNGLKSSDILDFWEKEGIKKIDLQPYTFPEKSEIQKNRTIGIFLGHYIPWDGHQNAQFSIKNGLATYDKWVEGSIVNYENLDNYQMRIHDYFKFLKYGFGRTTDHVSIDIRNNRLSREEGLNLVKQFEGKIPLKNLQEFLTEMEITKEEFYEICEKFTNKEIFKKDQHGNLLYDESHNLEKIIYDNS